MNETAKKLPFSYFFIFLTITTALEVLAFFLGMKSGIEEISGLIIFNSILGLSAILGFFSLMFGIVTSLRNKKISTAIFVVATVPLVYSLVFKLMMGIYR
ncbi:hypothetical protein Norbert_63 [Paenibacillus phage Norbert]|uniref:Uncharacterized protein n=6 Tax=Fernvirus jacopo TaxID=2845738 RepID=A0A345KQM0_9CAUD|nr:hypothetical protein HWB74_gp64 [Paenibacillus phage Jacopo]AXF40075.1 hypothetical protein BLOOM_64 [Paenibacillus phage Bloom]AXF40434.1 hypothetical protein LYCANUS1_64 [Paenibacillus phage Genki]AXF42301.1 hypothetical protein LYCANUS2_64 [Paenibacillus phage Gryphonian]AXH45322.1 hypothetical protein ARCTICFREEZE_64 [Paenibacillus phage Arcticfreeze]AXH45388.1 hypothetical protein DEVRI_64 [Paenibacillus phage DevRi]QVV19472.1 hypothetical protein Bert_70 [Paenibacillus phage Bert]QV